MKLIYLLAVLSITIFSTAALGINGHSYQCIDQPREYRVNIQEHRLQLTPEMERSLWFMEVLYSGPGGQEGVHSGWSSYHVNAIGWTFKLPGVENGTEYQLIMDTLGRVKLNGILCSQ